MSYLQTALKVIATMTLENIPASGSIGANREPKKSADLGKPFPADWLSRFDETTLERLAIMTVDGELADDEALEAIGKESKTIWSNPFPQGTPEAREASLAAVRKACNNRIERVT